jgi:hypothetical protein
MGSCGSDRKVSSLLSTHSVESSGNALISSNDAGMSTDLVMCAFHGHKPVDHRQGFTSTYVHGALLLGPNIAEESCRLQWFFFKSLQTKRLKRRP